MTEKAAARRLNASPDLGDKLEHLTATYREMQERHGPLLGFSAPPPADARQFQGEQARKGVLIDAAHGPIEKAAALLDKEADRHQQIGRLAYWIAGYELAHGCRDNVGPMQQLGDDHLKLAEGIREQRAIELEHGHKDALLPADIAAEVRAANANERQFATGRER